MLIDPLPYIKSISVIGVIYVPNYKHPGVAERVKAEVDEIEDMCYDKRKL